MTVKDNSVCHCLSTMTKLMTERKLKHVSEDRNDTISVLEQHEAIPADQVLYKEAL